MRKSVKFMKKFFVFMLFAVVTVSCSIDDDVQNYHFEFIETLNAEFPEEMFVGDTYEVSLFYNLPNTCYSVSGIDYRYTADFERTVAIVATVYEDSECDPIDTTEPYNVSFNFVPSMAGTYTFMFVSGYDEATNQYSYITYDVEVLE